MNCSILRLPSLLAVGTALLALSSARGQNITNGQWAMTQTPEAIEFRSGGELITAYHIGKNDPKPYFYPVIGPTGENVTRHFPMKTGVPGEPDDHVHHRSIWFGLGKVNDTDFWHEKEGSGRTVHTGMKGLQLSGNSMTFHTTTDWLKADGTKVCEDKRSHKWTRGADGSLIYDFAIQLIASQGDLLIGDDKEGAFALRVLPTMAMKGDVAKGGMSNSAGQEGTDVWGKRADWVRFFGPDSKGNPLSITMMDHPSNLRHPSWWHARDYGLFAVNPFGQSKFEKDAPKDAGDYAIKSGESVTLTYRVMIDAGKPETAALGDSYKAFATEEPGKP